MTNPLLHWTGSPWRITDNDARGYYAQEPAQIAQYIQMIGGNAGVICYPSGRRVWLGRSGNYYRAASGEGDGNFLLPVSHQ